MTPYEPVNVCVCPFGLMHATLPLQNAGSEFEGDDGQQRISGEPMGRIVRSKSGAVLCYARHVDTKKPSLLRQGCLLVATRGLTVASTNWNGCFPDLYSTLDGPDLAGSA